MPELTPQGMQATWQRIFPVIQEQVRRISVDSADDYIGFNANYDEGKLPFINPQLQQEVLIRVSGVRSKGQGETRNFYTEVSDGYDGYIYTPTAMQSELKIVSLSIIVNSDALNNEWNAWNTITNIYNRIYWTSVTEALGAVYCGILKRFPVNNISFNFRGRLVNAQAMDLEVCFTTNDLDLDTSNWIETVSITGNLTSDSGEILTAEVVI